MVDQDLDASVHKDDEDGRDEDGNTMQDPSSLFF